MPIVMGINPVLEALQARESIDKIYIQKGKEGPVFRKIRGMARQFRIPLTETDRNKLDRLSDSKKHQGVAALLTAVQYVPLETLVEKVQKFAKIPQFLILDRLTDPQNFGAIIRSAEVLGMQGIIFSLTENVPVTDLVIKASTGAIFHIDLCKVTNIASAVKYLKESGIWIYASSSHGSRTLWELDFTLPLALIIGSEGKGIRPLLLKTSDEVFRIPQSGKTESLNASVAAGIVMTEILKQRSAMPA